MRYGDKGDDVRLVQQQLLRRGYMLPSYGADASPASHPELQLETGGSLPPNAQAVLRTSGRSAPETPRRRRL